MAEIIIAKHRNGAVGDVLLRFRGEFARFQNPDDDVIVPMPGEAPGIIRSKMNGGGNSVPPPSPDAAPADNNPFGPLFPKDLYRSDIYLSLTELTRIISLKEKSVLI